MIQIDMEMPDNCYCCILCRHADMFCRRLGKMLDRDDCYDERPQNCPLHEVTADPDTVSRQDVITLVENIENRRLMGEIDLTYAPMLKGVKALPPSPSRPQEHEKSCDGCEWEDAEGEGCTNCARFYVDFYQNKRNGGAV